MKVLTATPSEAASPAALPVPATHSESEAGCGFGVFLEAASSRWQATDPAVDGTQESDSASVPTTDRHDAEWDLAEGLVETLGALIRSPHPNSDPQTHVPAAEGRGGGVAAVAAVGAAQVEGGVAVPSAALTDGALASAAAPRRVPAHASIEEAPSTVLVGRSEDGNAVTAVAAQPGAEAAVTDMEGAKASDGAGTSAVFASGVGEPRRRMGPSTGPAVADETPTAGAAQEGTASGEMGALAEGATRQRLDARVPEQDGLGRSPSTVPRGAASDDSGTPPAAQEGSVGAQAVHGSSRTRSAHGTWTSMDTPKAGPETGAVRAAADATSARVTSLGKASPSSGFHPEKAHEVADATVHADGPSASRERPENRSAQTVAVGTEGPSGRGSVRTDGVNGAGGEATAGRDLIDQLVSHAARLSVPRNASLRIQLRPASLGHLDLRLALHDGALTLQILAESESTRDMIQAALPQLRQALEGRSIGVAQVSLGSVPDGSGSWQSLSAPFSGPGQWQGEKRYPSAPTAQARLEERTDVDLAAAGVDNSRPGSHLVDYRI